MLPISEGRTRNGRLGPAVWAIAVALGLPAAAVRADGPAAPPGPPPAAPLFPLPDPFDLPPQVRELAERYRSAFGELAAGGRDRAVAAVARFEAAELAAHPGKAIEWLTQADGALLAAYLEKRPDCALPLADFYRYLVLAHASDRRYPLIQRSLRVADALLARMTAEAIAPTERRLTADAYASFAADLLTVPAPARAAEMLGQGLELAPDDTDGNIALAILLLRDRRPDDAEARLRHVLEVEPGNREARLRRALLRRGFSADGRAGRELERLATTGESDWIALVAAQEQARRLLAAGELEGSIAFLNRMIERFPGDSSLRVTLAFAAARSGRRSEAQLAAQAALATRPSAGEGPRRVFADLPLRLLREAAARANAVALSRLPSLAAAIAATAPAAALPSAPPAATPSTPASGVSAPATGARRERGR